MQINTCIFRKNAFLLVGCVSGSRAITILCKRLADPSVPFRPLFSSHPVKCLNWGLPQMQYKCWNASFHKYNIYARYFSFLTHRRLVMNDYSFVQETRVATAVQLWIIATIANIWDVCQRNEIYCRNIAAVVAFFNKHFLLWNSYVTKLYKQLKVFSNNIISKAVIKYIKYQYKEYSNK